MSDTILIKQVRAGIVPPAFYARYERRAKATATVAERVVRALSGSAGSSPRRAARAVPYQTHQQLTHSLNKLDPDEREAFAREVLRNRD
jgi:hypothetical protein